MGIVRAWLLIGASALLAAPPAGAEPFAYEFRGSAAGTLDGAPFPLQAFRLTVFADTADVTPVTSELLQVIGSAADFALDVSGAGSITTPLRVATNHTFGGISIAPANGGDLFGFYDVAFAAYDLATPIGPVVSTASYEQQIPVATSAGSLVFTAVADELVFEAPEPGAVGGAAALAALVTTSRRGRSRRASSVHRA